MQTRRKARDAGIQREREPVTPKRAPKKSRLLSSAVQQEEQAAKTPPQSPYRKQNVASARRGRQSPQPRRRSGTQSSGLTRTTKAAKNSTPPSQARKGRAESEKKEAEDKITINRAPVLTMWVAVVASREGYNYEEGLTFGKAIAGLLAQSKGRSLGVYEEPSEEKKADRKRKREDLDRFGVFGMNVPGKKSQDGLRLAMQSGKPISPASVAKYLHGSFGANYDRAKGAMEDIANSFPPDEIGRAAYSLYEKFRPTVPHGTKGWGHKGLLDVDFMRTLRK